MKKKYLFIVLSVILIIIGVLSIYHMTEQRATQREEEARLEEEREAREAEAREVAFTYLRLHYAFGRQNARDLEEAIDYGEDDLSWIHYVIFVGNERYQPLEVSGREHTDDVNPDGLNVPAYLVLRMYYQQTGIYLSYELVEDYFSQEFEPDGSRRLYNNGNHLEIEAFVNWMWEGRRGVEREEYRDRIRELSRQYTDDNGFQRKSLSGMSIQVLEALVRAEADPDYVLDLTSLWEAGQ